jgi:AAA domain
MVASAGVVHGDLRSTLFLAVPVVSTTFASVDRMLGDLPPSALGWLLVDEAGQATPQSVVGALMRAQRVVVVGDPLQIPPVVSLPDKLITDVCKYFNVSKDLWAAPSASVQTLADEASAIQAEFRGDVGVRRVGLPLLVHRRCLEPMFGISNRIAYDEQMVYAVAEEDVGPASRLLGPSAWLDIDGSATSKWCPDEGEVVVKMLKHLARAGLRKPDIYVITPFRIVAQELQSRISAEPGLLEQLGVDDHTWLRDRVGTIHTFQGKEAEAVIAVLGAPMASQQGARRWASYPPNILNVLVSRAKQRLYVVGSRAAWQGTGCCRAVADALPVMPAAIWKARIGTHRAHPELRDE